MSRSGNQLIWSLISPSFSSASILLQVSFFSLLLDLKKRSKTEVLSICFPFLPSVTLKLGKNVYEMPTTVFGSKLVLQNLCFLPFPISPEAKKKKHLFIFLLDLNTPPKRWCLLLLAAFCKLHEPRVSGSFILPVATLKVSTMPSTHLYVLQQSY